MSSGNFVISKYQATYSATAIHPVRVQPETLLASIAGTVAVVNSPPSGAVSNPIVASVRGSKRGNGLVCRRVTMRVSGTPPTGYLANGVTSIPALTPAFYNAAIKGATMTYLGANWVVTGRSLEVPV